MWHRARRACRLQGHAGAHVADSRTSSVVCSYIRPCHFITQWIVGASQTGGVHCQPGIKQHCTWTQILQQVNISLYTRWLRRLVVSHAQLGLACNLFNGALGSEKKNFGVSGVRGSRYTQCTLFFLTTTHLANFEYHINDSTRLNYDTQP